MKQTRKPNTNYNKLSKALNNISGESGHLSVGISGNGRHGGSNNASFRGNGLRGHQKPRLNVSNVQFSGSFQGHQKNARSHYKDNKNSSSVHIRSSRRIPRQQRSRLPVSPLDRSNRKDNQMTFDQRMTSAPEPSSSRHSRRNRNTENVYGKNNGSNKQEYGLLPRPSSRQRSSRGENRSGSRNGGSVNRVNGFVNKKLETKKTFPSKPFHNQELRGGNGFSSAASSTKTVGGNSKVDEVTSFLNSWNKIGRGRPSSSEQTSRQSRRNHSNSKNNVSSGRRSNRGKGLGQTARDKKNILVTEDTLIISMSPVAIKAKSKDDIFRLGDFDKHMIGGVNNDKCNTQLPPFGGYPSSSGNTNNNNTGGINIYYGNDTNNTVGTQLNQNKQVLHMQLLKPPTNNEEIFTRNLATTRANLDGRPVSRGRFRSSRGLPYGIPAISNRRARTSIGRQRIKMSDPNGFSPSSIKRARPSTAGGY